MPHTSDMAPEDFRRAGYAVVDWIADYLKGVGDLPVLPDMQPGDLISKLPSSAPERGESMDAILADFRDLIVPACTHWNHPRFHAYFAISSSGPGILAEALSAALNMNHMVWKSSPAGTELEQTVMNWLREWLGLPAEFFGVIYDTASVSTMHALICAREFVCPENRAEGAGGGRLTVYTSEQAHSSVEKSAMAVGFGQCNVRKIAVDSEFRMSPAALRETIEHDIHHGKRPCCIVPTVGTTSTSSIDPVPDIANIAAEAGAWMHVDASYAGPAAILPEFQWLFAGVERAHSLVVNPHKWLFTPVDLSVFYTSHQEVLRRALSIVPEYLKTSQDGQAINFMDYGVPLGRRFRALKLWFIMRYFGREGVIAILRNHIRWAQELAQEIEADGRFELAAPVPLGLICFRRRGSNEENQRLLERVNASGKAFLSHTVLNGHYVLRLSVGNIKTTRDDLALVWETIRRCAGSE